MKIYNEVITKFNNITGKWETIYEDSFEYSGDLALLQYSNALGDLAGIGRQMYLQGVGFEIDTSEITGDKITETLKITQGYFTNGDGTLNGTDIYTSSLADSNEQYYFNVSQTHPLSSSAASQFSVTYGHQGGSGSDMYGDTNTRGDVIGETQAIYKQFAGLLLGANEASGGFKISQAGSHADSKATNIKDDDIYVLIGKRERFKDRMNKKTWTLNFSGSLSTGAGANILELTDDSSVQASTTTPAGNRYNIVSGSVGSVHTVATEKTYGWFYPDMGIMVFSQHELSASIPGTNGSINVSSSFSATKTTGVLNSSGFAPNLHDKHTTGADGSQGTKNTLRFVNCMRNMGDNLTFRMRSEEDQTQVSYFCRAKARQANFSTNPTWVSGSDNRIRNVDMRGNPQVFITGVGLYNTRGDLVAIAKLSTPLKKNYASEATIKVKLTY